MTARLLLSLLALANPLLLGFVSLYGPPTGHTRAGDQAPDLIVTGLLHAPAAASRSQANWSQANWSQANLTGNLTYILFAYNTSANLEQVTAWNQLVDRYQGKPVQFLWITSERKQTLLPWLSQHPVKGWVFADETSANARAYGLVDPASVWVGPDRSILGFDNAFVPQPETVDAALAGRTTTTRPTRDTLKAFAASRQALLAAEPPARPRPGDLRPTFAPSDTLHVTPSTGDERGNFSSGDFLVLKGFTLQQAILQLKQANPSRLRMPAALDSASTFDFALRLPAPVSRDELNQRFLAGLESFFHFTLQQRTEQVDTYVLTALADRPPKALDPEREATISASGAQISYRVATLATYNDTPAPAPVAPAQIVSFAASGTIDDLCHTLETALDRPVVNQTSLAGSFRIQLDPADDPGASFPDRLRSGYGLVLTPAPSPVLLLVVAPR